MHDLDLEIGDGELMVLVGPSGCGKTTALRMLAGLEEISDGEIRIGDRIVNDLTPKDRDIAMVFQSYALYPHMTVCDNLAFRPEAAQGAEEGDQGARPASARRSSRSRSSSSASRARSREASAQRVAMGRAIVRQPQAFLMDEPLSNLDAKLRVQLRAEIHQLQRRLGVTTIYVTHDQVEAMTMGDRVAVMNAGHLQQVDTPQVLYDNPRNEFVAGFIGSPSINLVAAHARAAGRQTPGRLRRPPARPSTTRSSATAAASRTSSAADVILGIRPEDFEDATLESDAPADRRLRVVCDLTEPLGLRGARPLQHRSRTDHLERHRGGRRRGRRGVVRERLGGREAPRRASSHASARSRGSPRAARSSSPSTRPGSTSSTRETGATI